jgi:hypothetical protein
MANKDIPVQETDEPSQKKPGDAGVHLPAKEAVELIPPAPPAKPLRLGEKLISLGLLSPDQLDIVLTEQKSSKKLIGAILVEMGFLTESALGEVLAESSGTKKFDPKATMLDSSVVRLIPKEIATRYKIIAVGSRAILCSLP